MYKTEPEELKIKNSEMPPKRKPATTESEPSKKKSKGDTNTLLPAVEDLQETEYLKMLDVKKSALLGYATMAFADKKDMGKGLTVETRKFNPRAVTNHQLNALTVAVGGDPNNHSKPCSLLNRYSPEHAMFMLIKPQYINLSSLCKDPFGSKFSRVQWAPEAKDAKDVASLINGNTRRHLCVQMGRDSISEFDSVRLKLLKTKAGGEEHQSLLNEQHEALIKIRTTTSWLVAFFDQGGGEARRVFSCLSDHLSFPDLIEASSFRNDLLYELSKNQPTYQAPDSDVDTLQLTINYILNVPENERLDKIQQATEDSSYMLQGMPKRLLGVFKDSSLFMALVKLNPYSILWRSRPLTVHLVNQWRVAGAPVSVVWQMFSLDIAAHKPMQFMEAIILQGVIALDFLSSTQDHSEDLSVDDVGKKMIQTPPIPVPGVLNAAFFDILDAVYKKHLYKIREFFGLSKSSQRDQETWASAMEAYWVEIEEEVKKWCAIRKREIGLLRVDTVDVSQIESVLNKMTSSLTWINNGLFNTVAFGMWFPSPAPLLCPMFLLDVSESVTTLKDWLDLIWRWLDPYVTSSMATARFHGSSLSVMASLRSMVPLVEERELMWAIASEIFCMRTDAVVALRNADKAAKTSPLAPGFSALPMFEDMKPKTVCSVVNIALKAWRSSSTPDVINSGALRMRNLHKDQKHNIQNLPNGEVILNSLAATAFPWAACPSNQVTGRLQSASQTAVQALWVSDHQNNTYSDIKAYWVLRHAIQELLQDMTTGFKGFWDGLECPSEDQPKMPSSPQGPESISTRGQLSAQSKANAIQIGTEKAMQAIVKILCTEETGAIPVPEDETKSDFQPFEEVHEAAMALFESLAVASCRAQSVYQDPGHDRLSIISKQKRTECLATFDIPRSFKPAPFDVIQTHYASFDSEQLSSLDVFGPGSLAFQKRKELNSKKKSPDLVPLSQGAIITVDEGNVLVEDTPLQAKTAVVVPNAPSRPRISFPSPPSQGFSDRVLASISLAPDAPDGGESDDGYEKTLTFEE